MQRFVGKVVIVTGAGSGIGKATAERFLDEGAKVILVGRTQEKLDAVASAYPSSNVFVLKADVSSENEVNEAVAAAVERFRRLDVLVNNAGVVTDGDVGSLSTSDWRKVMENNLDGVFYFSRAALPHLKPTAGSIVNVSSVSGRAEIGVWRPTTPRRVR